MSDFQQFAPTPAGPGEGAGVAQDGALDATSVVPPVDEQIGQESPSEQQQHVDLTQLPEFRKYQSAIDRQLHQARMAAEAAQREAAELRAHLERQAQAQQHAEFEARLRQARTPEERAQMELEFRERQIQSQAEVIAAREAQLADVEHLRGWDQTNLARFSKVGIPTQVYGQINALAQEAAGGDLGRFHEVRQLLVDEALVAMAAGEGPFANLRAQRAPQQPPQMQQPTQAQRPQQPQAQRPAAPPAAARPSPSNPGAPDILQLYREGRFTELKNELNRMGR